MTLKATTLNKVDESHEEILWEELIDAKITATALELDVLSRNIKMSFDKRENAIVWAFFRFAAKVGLDDGLDKTDFLENLALAFDQVEDELHEDGAEVGAANAIEVNGIEKTIEVLRREQPDYASLKLAEAIDEGVAITRGDKQNGPV